MKSLKQYLNESLSDVKQYIVNELNGDFDMALNILKNGNSMNSLLQGVDDFIARKNNQLKNNPSKNAGYYLSKLFELSGLDAKSNEKIIKSIVKNNLTEELNEMLNTLLTKDKLQKNIDGNFLKLFIENQNNKSLNLLQYTKNFENLAKYIFDITKFTKEQNNASVGKGELLLQLLIGVENTRQNTSHKGDVFLQTDETLEVKAKGGKLGKSILNSTGTTDYFIKKLNKAEIIGKIEYNGSCFGGKKEKGNNSQNVFNNFWKNIKLNENADINKIFEYYIETILHKYNQESKININVFNDLIQNANPFQINDDKHLIIYNNKMFIDITGFLYLYAYQMSEEFNYLIVFDEKLNFKCLNCENFLRKYDAIVANFRFMLPGNTDDPENRSNVPVIGIKK